ncbi:MAG: hypothetical protein GY926_27175 [bacterium]|nr:hypothetical protein [bacterium]
MNSIMTNNQFSAPALGLCPISDHGLAVLPLLPVDQAAHKLQKSGHQTVSTDARFRTMGTGTAMACITNGDAARTEHMGAVSEGLWFYTPNFDHDDHFQRWRCAT